jgi:hypothetical protein
MNYRTNENMFTKSVAVVVMCHTHIWEGLTKNFNQYITCLEFYLIVFLSLSRQGSGGMCSSYLMCGVCHTHCIIRHMNVCVGPAKGRLWAECGGRAVFSGVARRFVACTRLLDRRRSCNEEGRSSNHFATEVGQRS